MRARPLLDRPAAATAWWLALRPRTLGASIVPVLVGSALGRAAGAHHGAATATCLLAALLLQIAANLSNDALDHARGVDAGARLGPTRVTQAGWLTYRAVMTGATVALILAAACGAYLIALGGWPILGIGVLSMAAALAYSGGPYPLASHGLGEVAAFVFFGPVAVVGSAYLHTASVTLPAVLASVPIGALVTCIMVVNNLRDIPTDAAVGKRTLAVRLGPRGTRILYSGLIGLAILWPLVMLGADMPWAVLAWLSLPLVPGLLRSVGSAREGAQFNSALADTARLHAAYGLLYALGLAL